MYYCDTCGKRIEDVEDGWIEWLNSGVNGKTTYKGMRLVHHNKVCRYNETVVSNTHKDTIVSDNHLKYFIGDDGLMRMFEYLSDGFFEDTSEVYEMIKRLNVAGYEKARKNIDKAYYDGIINVHEKENGLLYQVKIKEINSTYVDFDN